MTVVPRRLLLLIVAIALAAAGFALHREPSPWRLLLGAGVVATLIALLAGALPAAAQRALPWGAAGMLIALGAGGLLGERATGSPLLWPLLAGALALLLLAAERLLGGRDEQVARAGVAMALLLAGASLFHLVATGKRHDVPGIGTVFALDDDMMITLRYAQNLARGDGLVWNAGERVEGITNLLWALLLAPLHWVLPTERVAAGAIALNALLFVLLLFATVRLVRQLGGSGLAAGLAALALATHQATLHWVAGGGEAALLALLLLWVASRALQAEPTRREALGAALLAGLAWLARPDALPALLPLLALLAWPRNTDGRARRALEVAAAAALLPLAATLFRFAYYGSALPNTYWLKMTGWSGRAEAGVAYVAAGLLHHFGFAAAALLGALRLAMLPRATDAAALRAPLAARVALALLFSVLLHGGYVLYAGGDELPLERFLLPTVPLLFALGFAGASARPAAEPHPGLAVAPLLLLAFGTIGGGFVPFTRDPAQLTRATAERANTMIGYLLRANTEPDATVAHFWAGAAAYFSQRRGLDLLGKCDPVIARQEAKAGLMKPGHNKYDFAHSLALEPDVIVGGDGGAATLAFLAEKYLNPASPHHGYRAFAELYRHPDFAGFYCRAGRDEVGVPAAMPQLVGGMGSTLAPEYADVSRRFHALFVRAGSTRARPPAQWTAPTLDSPR